MPPDALHRPIASSNTSPVDLCSLGAICLNDGDCLGSALNPMQAAKSPVSRELSPKEAFEQAGCPTPLVWRDVVRKFTTESRPFESDSRAGRVRGFDWGDGPGLVVLPPLGGNAEFFSLIVHLLKDQFRCLVWDRTLRVDVTLPRLVDEITCVLDQLELPSASLLGVGWGSVLAYEFACRSGSRVDNLLLQAGGLPEDFSAAERFALQLGRWLPLPLGLLPGWNTLHAFNHQRWFSPMDATRYESLRDHQGAIPASVLAAQVATIARWKPMPISHPPRTLVIRPEGEGAAAAAGSEAYLKSIPAARTGWLHNSGRFPYLTHPHRTAKLIRDFLTIPDDQLVAEPDSFALSSTAIGAQLSKR